MKNPFNAGAETGKQPYLVFAKAKELEEAGPPEANNIEMFAKVPLIYYVSTSRGKRGLENINFCILTSVTYVGVGESKKPEDVLT